MPVFTIKTQAAESDEILEQYPYWIWYPAEQTLTISKSTYAKTKAYEANGIIFRAPGADADIETTTFYYYYITPIEPDVTVVLRYYVNLGVWQAEMPWELETDDGWIECPIGYQHQYSTSTLAVPIYTNGHTIATGSGSGITNSWSINGSLPSDMPDITIGMGDINATINDALNATTSATTQAGTIQSNVNNKLDQYEQGQITSNQMQSIIDTANTQLDDLASQSGNTLSDQIAINNAQNAVQIAQDKILSQDIIDKIAAMFKLSPQMSNYTDLITGVESVIREYYTTQYINGQITKNEALIEGFAGLPPLTELKASEISTLYTEASTQADYEIINQISNMIDNGIDIINSAGDVDKDIAENLESSDEEEKQYLESAIAETTKSINNLQSDVNQVITDSDAQEINDNIITPLLDNVLIKNLLPIAALFMVICVTLGTRYRL